MKRAISLYHIAGANGSGARCGSIISPAAFNSAAEGGIKASKYSFWAGDRVISISGLTTTGGGISGL
jgi:hypothetical protein